MAHLLADRGRPPATLVLLDPGTLKPHRLRLRAEAALAQNPASLLARWRLLRAVGRLSPDAAGFEPAMIRLRVLRAWGSLLLGEMTRAKTATRYRGAGLRIGPRAWLNAAYRHAWPAPLPLQAQIIASKAREKDYLRADGPWACWLPDRVAHVMVDTHEDILSGTSAPVAAAMEALLLGRDLPPGIATTRHPAPTRAATGTLGAPATAGP
ncbi:MAG TPA: hypothetical protein VLA78_08315, partial [Paracoccaceae bacterium]|nr:hypothetical protein [Paracoccaceae bacterium]